MPDVGHTLGLGVRSDRALHLGRHPAAWSSSPTITGFELVLGHMAAAANLRLNASRSQLVDFSVDSPEPVSGELRLFATFSPR